MSFFYFFSCFSMLFLDIFSSCIGRRYEIAILFTSFTTYNIFLRVNSFREKIKVSSIRTPTLIQERLQRMEVNLMKFKWEVT